jgi:hypothetical protein
MFKKQCESEPTIEERFRFADEKVTTIRNDIERLYRERREAGARWNLQERPDGNFFFTCTDIKARTEVESWLRDWRKRLAEKTKESNRALSVWAGLRQELAKEDVCVLEPV